MTSGPRHSGCRGSSQSGLLESARLGRPRATRLSPSLSDCRRGYRQTQTRRAAALSGPPSAGELRLCGIAGVVGEPDGRRSILAVRQMCTDLARRGPDAEGTASWDGVVFGHRRLAIFDLSDAGRQPMVTPDNRVGVVFNGAIYN